MCRIFLARCFDLVISTTLDYRSYLFFLIKFRFLLLLCVTIVDVVCYKIKVSHKTSIRVNALVTQFDVKKEEEGEKQEEAQR